MKRALIAAGAVLALSGVAGGLAWRAYVRPGPAATDRVVLLSHGTSLVLGEALARAGVVSDPRAFQIAARVTAAAGRLRAGEFRFPAGASLRDVLAVLRTAKPVRHSLTIPEGLTAAQIARLFAADPALDGEVAVPAEGSVLPETYLFERPARAEELRARAEQAASRKLAAEWARRAPGLPLRSAQDAVTLASIVEKETRLPEERPLVAAVFLNRLRLGMKLQADPTTEYAVLGGLGAAPGHAPPLTRDALESSGPYNTYTVPALPAGPICAPGAAALEAVLHPATTDALYFVANGRGGHSFAASLAEHTRNVARWRRGP